MVSHGRSGKAPSLITKRQPLGLRLRKQWVILAMMLPGLACVFIFSTVPLTGLWMAFTRYQVGKSIFSAPFVGLDNFRRLFVGGDIGYLLRNTLILNISNLLASSLLSIIFAIMLRELPGKRLSAVMQTVSFLPFFISWVIVYSITQAMVGVNSGAVNKVLKEWGVISKGINVLGREEYAYGMTIFLHQWKSLGYNSILYVAAMAGISSELYEAAAIDGAGRFRSIWHITLPGIIPTFCVLFIMAAGNILNTGIDYFFVFTNATNWRRMDTFDMYVYTRGLQKSDFSYATAVGIMKSLVSFGLLTVANYTTKRLSGNSIF